MDHRRRAGVEALLHLNVLGREPYHQLEILTFNSAVQVEFEVREGGAARVRGRGQGGGWANGLSRAAGALRLPAVRPCLMVGMTGAGGSRLAGDDAGRVVGIPAMKRRAG